MRPVVLFLIKAIHTAAFVVIAGSILVVFFDGIRGRPRRRTGVAAGIALVECGVFAANGFVCPLTPLAERYGARRGSVTDIFLPDVIARNLTWIATPILVAGLGLNVRATFRLSRTRRPKRPGWNPPAAQESRVSRSPARLRRPARRQVPVPFD